MVYGFTLKHRVACLIHGFALIHGVCLDHEDFSSMPHGVTHSNTVHGFASKHGVTHSNMVYGFSLDHKDFSSILHALVHRALPRDLARVPPPGHIVWSSYPPALKLPLLVHPYNHLVEHPCSPLVDLVSSYSTAPKLLLLCLALDYTHVPMLLAEDPISSHTHLSKPCIDYDVPY